MKKSTYSLILMDRVVEEIDQRAAMQGTSRSNLINQILAEYVSCTTPEQQMQRFFSCLSGQMNSALRIQQQGSESMLSILGSVQYKYRPTIRYRVELYREMQQEEIGQLKITCRTQNQDFLSAMQFFFRFWVSLEQKYHKDGACAKGLYEIEPARMRVALLRQGTDGEEKLGTIAGHRIAVFHHLLQSYFLGLQQGVPSELLRYTLEQRYQEAEQ